MVPVPHEVCICNGVSDGALIRCSNCGTLYHCSCVGVDEAKAASMKNWICEFCTFEDPNDVDDDEEEYIFERDESVHRRRNRYDSHRSQGFSSLSDMFSGSIEEMNERNLMKAISSIEQKLLIEDESPSIHNPDEGKKTSSRQASDFSTMLSSYPELKSLRHDLQRKHLLHRLVRVKDLSPVNPSRSGDGADDLTEPMRYCVQTLSRYDPPPDSVPLRADIRTFDWERLAKAQRELTGRLFDVIMMDPPWQLATANPTRGVAIAYEQLGDDVIRLMPLDLIQTDGYLFLWVINAKYRVALDLLEGWGYTFVDEIAWVKCNRSRRLAKSHGFYLQHSKETCLVARKGNPPPLTNFGFEPDVIYSERLGQSQKPLDIYEMIERLVPNGYYLEVFGRRNNLRDNWVTIGNEL
ncbi:uncharacterized protein [Blastocystis hominis]|uniref:mRNA m(6)A methyltransferase n=1 Tax=Blastocystis hominis TaxID=12968 RepID=D8M4M5_BLAHO|nr:uncharacterized protein [Blastocystis hominis]CBK23014.2 unnamed protein product [Blastocystis hominis]|eukprot:XP_012897062.1 uncharacterized protein [Blastocystis hominis]